MPCGLSTRSRRCIPTRSKCGIIDHGKLTGHNGKQVDFRNGIMIIDRGGLAPATGRPWSNQTTFRLAAYALNHDYIPVEFVIHALECFSNTHRETASQIILHVHHHGSGQCGVLSY